MRSVHFPVYEQLLLQNVKQFREWLVFKAHRHLYHSTPGSSVIKEEEEICVFKSAAQLSTYKLSTSDRAVRARTGILKGAFPVAMRPSEPVGQHPMCF